MELVIGLAVAATFAGEAALAAAVGVRMARETDEPIAVRIGGSALLTVIAAFVGALAYVIVRQTIG